MVGFTRAEGKIGHMWQQTYAMCSTSTLRFQTASNNLIGLLTVGAVIGTGVTVGDYVIEWRTGSITGPIQLITGVGTDPAIQAFHPIISEPVVGGTYYPVIRYIVVNGIRYSPYFLNGQTSTDLLTCLGTINVVTMSCANGIVSTYSHTIAYNNTLQPANNATRNLKFNLDASTTRYAYNLTGFLVADRLTISYVNIADELNPIVIDDWVVGSNATTNYTSSPKVMGSGNQSLKNVLDLSTYTFQTGNYLILQVTPRYLQPLETNTNWTLNLKCLSNTQFICSGGNENMRTLDPSTVTATWNSTLCQWEFSWYNKENYLWPSYQYTYQQQAQYGGSNSTWDYATTGKCMLFLKQNTTTTNTYVGYTGACTLSAGNINIVKTGTSLNYTFSHNTDYLFYKNKYATLSADANITNYTSDDTSINHYKYLYNIIRVSPNCGDATTDKIINTHWLSPVTFNDALKTMNITLTNVSNGYPDVSCNTTRSIINNNSSQINTTISLANFNVDTSSYLSYAFSAYYVSQIINNETEITNPLSGFAAPSATHSALLSGCYPPNWTNITAYVGGTTIVGFPIMYNTVKITNTAAPSNNFRITRFFDPSTGAKLVTGVIVYEASMGVVIIP